MQLVSNTEHVHACLRSKTWLLLMSFSQVQLSSAGGVLCEWLATLVQVRVSRVTDGDKQQR